MFLPRLTYLTVSLSTVLALGCSGESSIPVEAGLPMMEASLQVDCESNTDCDDGLFCNGEETCVEGVCAPGEAPTLDDGIDCTVDACDEELDVVTNTADDTLCPNGDSLCGEDGVTLVGQIGRCNVEMMGCVLEDGATEDCSAVDPVRSCEGDEIREVVGFCQAGEGENPAECATRLELVEDCTAAALPTPMCMGAAASGDLSHSTYSTATCMVSETGPSCVPTEMSAACMPPLNTCAGGSLTSYEATCADEAGCASREATSLCPDRPDRCSSGRLTLYTPRCASDTECDPIPAGATTACPGASPICRLGSLTTFTPACSSDTSCGTPSSSTRRCADRPDSCTDGTLTRYTPTCASGSACSRTPRSSTSRCPDPSNSCVDGVLTRYSPACNASGTGCGDPTSSTSSCADRPDSCTDGVLTTYTPRCLSSTSCNSTPRSNRTTCPTRASSCSERTLTTYRPNCDGSSCGSPIAVRTTCDDSYITSSDNHLCTLTLRSCNATAGRCDATTESWRCDDTPNSCDTSGSTTVWRRGSLGSCPDTAPSSSGWCQFGDPIGGPSSVTCSGTYRQYCDGLATLVTVSYTGGCTATGGCTTSTSSRLCALGCVNTSAGGPGGAGSTARCRTLL